MTTSPHQAANAVNKLIASSDPLSGDAATTTQEGLQDSNDGIKIIPGASLTGQTAPVGQAGQDVLDQCGGGDAAAADIASKNTTSTNDLGTSGSDIGSGDSDSSSAAKSAFGSPAALVGLHNSRIFGRRQIGDISCNVARFQTVGRLAQASIAVNSVKSAASADPAAVAAAGQAGTALNSAKDGIAKIAVAIVAGQKAPVADRDQVQKGLDDAMTALTGIVSADPKVTTAISNAQEKIMSTLEAGNRVVSDC